VNALFETLRRLGPAKVALLAAVGVGLLGFFGFFANRLTQPPMALLYAELSGADAGQIVTRLEQQNVPFELRAGGSQVWVPADRALRLRMGMAEQGLPRGGSVGYEIFDRSDALGASSFVQNLNHLRALEGELARTIGSLGPVAAARVHLVVPRRDLFARERQEPTASVALKLRDAGRLPRPQVQAIQQLVAAAVPGLKPGRVSVVDDRGNLLARGTGEGEETNATAAAADDLRRTAEQAMARKIEEQIERAVGPGKVRAEVALEMDFDRVVTNSEAFDPDGQVVRSQQTVSENNDSSEAGSSQGVSVGNNLPDGADAGGASQNRSRGTRQEETVNYEITRTTRSHVREGGVIKRLSASIIVDGMSALGGDGKRTYQARNPEEIEQLKALARSAVGFDQRRGDTLELVNLPFAAADAVELPPEPGMLDFSRADIFRAAELGVLLIVALLLILLVARPLVGAIGRAGARGGARATEPLPTGAGGTAPAQLAGPGAIAGALPAPDSADAMIDLGRVEGRVKASAIKKIGEIVEKHPDEAVAIVRTWMYQEA